MVDLNLSRFSVATVLLVVLLRLPVNAGCVTSYTANASPPPTNGTYACGQTVTFCVTISGWSLTNSNWFHGIIADFGPGWDMSTLVPGTPPATVNGTGTWGWYNSVTGTNPGGANQGPQGPGFFFDLDNDGDPGNNFGDFSGTGPWTFCWTISVASGGACVQGADLSVVITAFADSQTGSWTLGGCGQQTLTTLPATVGCAYSGNDNVLTVCADSAPVDLFPLLGAAGGGGTWTTSDGSSFNGVFNPAIMPAGACTYLLPGACPDDHATVTVSVNLPPSAGMDGSLTVCDIGAPTDLFTSLGGSPDLGGTWTGPDGLPHSSNYSPAIDGPGAYTYTVVGTAPCSDASATVIVTETAMPNAGPDANIALCSDGALIDLSSLLIGADPGGTWTAPDGTAHGAMLDPASASSGAYLYTLAATLPCSGDQAIVNVTVDPSPNAGVNASLTVCDQGAPTDLYASLGISADPGGTWTGPGGLPHSGNYDPAVDGPGAYTYTIVGTAPCSDASATVTVFENATPIAGPDASITLCSDSAPIDLSTLLTGADPGGSWTDPDGSPQASMLDPTSASSGDYVYTLSATAPCIGDQASVTVTINMPPNAGTDASVALCDQSAITDLLPSLGPSADEGGAWTGPGGLPHSSSYNPIMDGPGAYTYTVPGTSPCANASATVTVSENSTPNAGPDATIALCNDGSTIDLSTLLTGADPGGSWTDPDGSAQTSMLDPATASTGAYIYTLTATAPCTGDQATVTVTVNVPPAAGNNASLTVCDESVATDLFASLGSSAGAGGTWTGPGGLPHSSSYNPIVDGPGAYTYTIAGSAPCSDASATVTVIENAMPHAGPDAGLTLCSTSSTIDLNTLLTAADPGGTWTGPSGNSAAILFNPATDQAGIYTYLLNGTTPCHSDSALMTIAVHDRPNAGSDTLLHWCTNGNAVDLTAELGGTPDPGGTWTTPSGSLLNGLFDPASNTEGQYTYTVPGLAPCPSASSVITVGLDPLPVPGSNTAVLTCINSEPFELLPLLGAGTTQGGDWTSADGSSMDGTFDPSNMPGGTLTYELHGSGACAHVVFNTQVGITVAEPPSATFTTDLVQGCAPLSIAFTLDDPSIVGSNWHFNDGSSGIGAGSLIQTFGTPGWLAATVDVTDANGCTATGNAEHLVFLQPPPSAVFAANPPTTDSDHPDITFTPEHHGYTNYAWAIDGLATGDGDPWTNRFNDYFGGRYEVCLTVHDSVECTASYCLPVTVNAPVQIDVPNAFTPDGDGRNDDFLPIITGTDGTGYEFLIFDRWGEKVFGSDELGEAWNGALNNGGAVLPQDVYVWSLRVGNGVTADRKELRGHVTLLK